MGTRLKSTHFQIRLLWFKNILMKKKKKPEVLTPSPRSRKSETVTLKCALAFKQCQSSLCTSLCLNITHRNESNFMLGLNSQWQSSLVIIATHPTQQRIRRIKHLYHGAALHIATSEQKHWIKYHLTYVKLMLQGSGPCTLLIILLLIFILYRLISSWNLKKDVKHLNM